MAMHTLEQERAQDALGKVDGLRDKSDKFKKEYVSYVEGLPANIVMNGLGQAAATLLSAAKGDNENPHMVLYDNLSSWLCRNNAAAPYPKGEDLMRALTSNDRVKYLRAQTEAMAWLEWHKKLATAYLKRARG